MPPPRAPGHGSGEVCPLVGRPASSQLYAEECLGSQGADQRRGVAGGTEPGRLVLLGSCPQLGWNRAGPRQTFSTAQYAVTGDPREPAQAFTSPWSAVSTTYSSEKTDRRHSHSRAFLPPWPAQHCNTLHGARVRTGTSVPHSGRGSQHTGWPARLRQAPPDVCAYGSLMSPALCVLRSLGRWRCREDSVTSAIPTQLGKSFFMVIF